MEKRYVLTCSRGTVFETDERGAAVAKAYLHDEAGCTVRLLDRHTNTEIEL
jgi:hypothetical protein